MERILLADDNQDLRSALRLLLETRLRLDLVIEARDMEHVLAQVEEARPDCIILDWELPGRPARGRLIRRPPGSASAPAPRRSSGPA